MFCWLDGPQKSAIIYHRRVPVIATDPCLAACQAVQFLIQPSRYLMSFSRVPLLYPLIGLAVLAVAICAPTQAMDDRMMILPEKVEWAISAEVNGNTVVLRMPAERHRINALPGNDGKMLLERVKRVEANQKQIRKVGKSYAANAGRREHRLTPDYQRTLSEVAISVSYADAEAGDPLWRHMPVLKALPDYSQIHVIMPTPAEKAVRQILARENLLGRAIPRPLQDWNRKKENITRYSRNTRWIRDTFLVGQNAQAGAMLYLPLAYAKVSDLVNSDLNFVPQLVRNPNDVLGFPAFIRGGNIAVADNTHGRRIAFMGATEIEQNREHYLHSIGLEPPQQMTLEIIKRLAGVPKVSILPNTAKFFHIDMAISFLGPGLAALVAPIDEASLSPEEGKALLDYRMALAASGFRIINIPTTVARINVYQSPVNILPYTDRNTNRRIAIVPQFPDVTVNIAGKPQSLNRAIKAAYASAGIEVKWAEDRFSDRWGNVHCSILGLN